MIETMTRQFDVALQNLGKMLYTFFKDNGIESQDEKEALLKMATDKFIGEWMIEKSAQYAKETIARATAGNKHN